MCRCRFWVCVCVVCGGWYVCLGVVCVDGCGFRCVSKADMTVIKKTRSKDNQIISGTVRPNYQRNACNITHVTTVTTISPFCASVFMSVTCPAIPNVWVRRHIDIGLSAIAFSRSLRGIHVSIKRFAEIDLGAMQTPRD